MGKIIDRVRQRERIAANNRQVAEWEERIRRDGPGDVVFVPTCGTEAALADKLRRQADERAMRSPKPRRVPRWDRFWRWMGA